MAEGQIAKSSAKLADKKTEMKAEKTAVKEKKISETKLQAQPKVQAQVQTPVQTKTQTPLAAEKIEATTEKTAEKKDKKTETAKKDKKEEVAKVAPVKKKFIPYIKKENKSKSKEARENQKKIITKKHTPVFRGRFGKKNIRRKSIAKWNKWRKPHGIDLDKGIQHGFRPKIGYGRSIETRHLHPSGYAEVMVCNFNDLAKIEPKTQAARISATVGKKKRNELVKKANEKGIWVLN